LLGLESSISTAALVSLMFLMIPKHEELNWDYVFQRSIDTALGCAIAIGVGLVLWPRNGIRELLRLEGGLRATLQAQSQAHHRWLQGLGNRPEPLRPEPLAATLQTMEQLVARELRGPHAQRLQEQRWRQRLRLWDRVQHHWCAWEALLLNLPGLEPQSGPDPLANAVADVNGLLAGTPAEPPGPDPSRWQALARHRQVPLLMLLAFAEEQRPLAASLNTLRLVAPCR
ncbi:MAG: FUSC family protein, partial [Cyanobacteriota bacterium]|nr:FUSC family protein [Cyanobacteriota bacterium]